MLVLTIVSCSDQRSGRPLTVLTKEPGHFAENNKDALVYGVVKIF